MSITEMSPWILITVLFMAIIGLVIWAAISSAGSVTI